MLSLNLLLTKFAFFIVLFFIGNCFSSTINWNLAENPNDLGYFKLRKHENQILALGPISIFSNDGKSWQGLDLGINEFIRDFARTLDLGIFIVNKKYYRIKYQNNQKGEIESFNLPEVSDSDFVRYGNGKFVVIDSIFSDVLPLNSGKSLISANGLNWEVYNIDGLHSVVDTFEFFGGNFILVSDQGGSIWYSKDGKQWSKVQFNLSDFGFPNSTLHNLRDIAFDGKKFILPATIADLNSNFSHVVFISKNLKSWEIAHIETDKQKFLPKIIFDGNLFIIKNNADKGSFFYSQNGSSWRALPTPGENPRLVDLAFFNGLYIGLASQPNVEQALQYSTKLIGLKIKKFDFKPDNRGVILNFFNSSNSEFVLEASKDLKSWEQIIFNNFDEGQVLIEFEKDLQAEFYRAVNK